MEDEEAMLDDDGVVVKNEDVVLKDDENNEVLEVKVDEIIGEVVVSAVVPHPARD
jgi:hypothetical protein